MVPHRCPVCDGSGRIAEPESTVGSRPCHACSGSGIVWEPDRYQACRCPQCQPQMPFWNVPITHEPWGWHTTTWSPDTT